MPEFFLPHERAEFAAFLDSPPGEYFVVRDGDEIVACGGVSRRGDEADLCWGMVRASLHRRGIGGHLLEHRLAIARAWRVARVRIHTSQHTEAFFAAAGFTETAREKDGFGPGLDRLTMFLEWAAAS